MTTDDRWRALADEATPRCEACYKRRDRCTLCRRQFERVEQAITQAVSEVEQELELSQADATEMEVLAERLQAETQRLREALEKAEMAIGVLKAGMGGHNHWDRQGANGAKCPMCQGQYKALKKAEALWAEARALLTETEETP